MSNKRDYLKSIIYIETENGSGSGFIITEDGYAVTCAHVVDECQEIYVKTKTDTGYEVYSATLVDYDKKTDIAILKIEEGIYFYSFISEDDYEPHLGEEIIILGYPFGKRMNDDVMNLNISFAKGYISSNQMVDGVKKSLLDISAKAGNSGSPIVSLETGAVIGILCGSILGGTNGREEINYMLPISYIDRVLR